MNDREFAGASCAAAVGSLLSRATIPEPEASGKMETDATQAIPTDDVAARLGRIREDRDRIRHDLARAIVGMDAVTDLLLGAILAGGHCLLQGVPGLAKTLLVKSVGQTLGLRAARIQFTPDLLPGDITGAEVIHLDKDSGERVFRFIKGPIFTNLLLADEINRTPPKTQAALMEAMEEQQVTSLGTVHRLDDPFLVIATQNPIEQEATYPLPIAQLDRFMYMVHVDYPSFDEEYRIIRHTTTRTHENLAPILDRDEVLWLQRAVRTHPVPRDVQAAAIRLCRLSRPDEADAPAFVRDWISWGAGPRAEHFLTTGARANALLDGRAAVEMRDLLHVAKPVLRHRLVLNYQAEADGIAPDTVVERLVDEIPALRALRARDDEAAAPAGIFGRLFKRRA